MHNNVIKSSLLKMLCRSSVVVAACLVLWSGLSANAQGVGSSRGLPGSDGNHTIQGRVYFPSGESPEGKSVKVRLESVSSFGLSAVTDQDGAFRFNNLHAGDYTVVVDAGKEYETVRESVNIDRQASVNVPIQLRLKAGASSPAFANVPQTAIDLYQKGVAAAQKGNAKSAVELLNKAVVAYPSFAVALNELGIQYLKLSQWDKAAETFEALLKLHASDSTAQLNLGIAFYNQNKLEQAETHLREALKLKSNGPSAHYYLGMALLKTKRYEEAEKELQLTVSNGGDNIALVHKYLGGLYLGAHQNSAAADELEKYLSLDPKTADAERIKGTIKELRAKQ
ncbi:MAG TPA: tetratricopeptide repeat protein [Pyrinomonadaceae bacterium]|nr:tetratricopeptide repeat protein [Pyrinomonadaceae bacterium]